MRSLNITFEKSPSPKIDKGFTTFQKQKEN